jgi:hypothetical protein
VSNKFFNKRGVKGSARKFRSGYSQLYTIANSQQEETASPTTFRPLLRSSFASDEQSATLTSPESQNLGISNAYSSAPQYEPELALRRAFELNVQRDLLIEDNKASTGEVLPIKGHRTPVFTLDE